MQSGGAWSNYQDDVFPMVANPASFISQFPPNAVVLNAAVNGLFSQLLDQLHAAFNSTTPDTGIQGRGRHNVGSPETGTGAHADPSVGGARELRANLRVHPVQHLSVFNPSVNGNFCDSSE